MHQRLMSSMRIRFPPSLLAAVCCCHAACVSSTPPAVGVAEDWQLTLSTAGGIAGIEQRFAAASANEVLTVVDELKHSEINVPLTRADKHELAQRVVARAGAPDINKRSAACRDCVVFEMTLTVGHPAKPRRVLYDSATMDESPDARLIERIVSIGRKGVPPATR